MISDSDIVNLYFRTTDHTDLPLRYEVKLLAPIYVHKNLDSPVVLVGLEAAIRDSKRKPAIPAVFKGIADFFRLRISFR